MPRSVGRRGDDGAPPEGACGELTRRDFLGGVAVGAGSLLLDACASGHGSATRSAGTSTGAASASLAVSPSASFGPQLDRFMLAHMRGAHVPSIAAAAMRGTQLKWSNGYGQANIEQNTLSTPDTVYAVACLSKTIICCAFMQLWEAGSADLDADVNTYLPFEVRNPNYPSMKITPRMLLTHTSSIRDDFAVWGSPTDPTPQGYCPGDPTIPLGSWLADYLAPGGAYYTAKENYYDDVHPGARYRYSHIATDAAAYIVECVSGTPFGDYCKASIFAPLSMAQTGYHLADITTTNLAMPYQYNSAGGAFTPYYQYGLPNYPSRGLRTSASALSRWLRCFMNFGELDGVRILEKATVREIRRPQIPGNDWQGLIWYYSGSNSQRLLSHNGYDYGAFSRMQFDPARDVGIVELSNRWIDERESRNQYLAIQDRLFELA